jgi:hypothetical protein
MIIFVTVPHHAYTVKTLARNSGVDGHPEVRAMDYDAFWTSRRLPRAAYILADIERLTAHERQLAAALRGSLLEAGLPCLNDPLRVPTRHGLLLRLHAAGLNPFRAWRAEDRPRPAHFPVFLRMEADHGKPIGDLILDQRTLDAALDALPQEGFPTAGVLVVEYCAEPIAPGVWRKWGTQRVGPHIVSDYAVTEDRWCVKYGSQTGRTEAMIEEEHAAVASNAHAEILRPAFDLAGIEYGRADHAVVGGRHVVYEINTNPLIADPAPQPFPLRLETMRIAREGIVRALQAIDLPAGGEVAVEATPLLERWRRRSKGAAMAFRP